MRRSGTTANLDPHAYTYSLPASTATVTPQPKAAASTSTSKAKTYKVVTKLRGFTTADDALNNKNPKTTVNAGTYFVFNERNAAINVSTKQGTAGSWINASLNKIANTAASNTTTSAIKAGDKVRINPGAVYGGLSSARGKKIPDSVISGRRYTVVRIQTNNKVSEALLNEINSWVAVRNLNKK